MKDDKKVLGVGAVMQSRGAVSVRTNVKAGAITVKQSTTRDQVGEERDYLTG